MDLKQLQRL